MNPDVDIIRGLVADGDLGAAIERLLALTRGSRAHDEALKLSGTYRRAEREHLAGLLGRDDLRTERAKEQAWLLDILTRLDNAGPQPMPAAPRKLGGSEMKELSAALLGAFPSRNALAQMLHYELDKHLDAIAGPLNMADPVFEVLQASESQGWTRALVAAAVRANRGNAALAAFAAKYGG